MTLRMTLPRLTLFDLDHTLLSGDSDVLWCEFLMALGILDRSSFAPRNIDMEARYKQGTVGVQEFADFYVGTLAGRSPAQWEPVRQQFLRQQQERTNRSAAFKIREQKIAHARIGLKHLHDLSPSSLHGAFSPATFFR